MPSSHLILCFPLLLLPIPPSVRVFFNESTLHMRWPKYWSFSFSIEGLEELFHVQGQEGRRWGDTPLPRYGAAAALCWSSCEEIPHVQGKRNPSITVGVARGHQRTDTLNPYSQKTSQSNHTRTTTLSNSMKLSHAHGATQDGRVMVERSDRMWSTGEGNGKPLSILALRTPWTVWKIFYNGLQIFTFYCLFIKETLY